MKETKVVVESSIQKKIKKIVASARKVTEVGDKKTKTEKLEYGALKSLNAVLPCSLMADNDDYTPEKIDAAVTFLKENSVNSATLMAVDSLQVCTLKAKKIAQLIPDEFKRKCADSKRNEEKQKELFEIMEKKMSENKSQLDDKNLLIEALEMGVDFYKSKTEAVIQSRATSKVPLIIEPWHRFQYNGFDDIRNCYVNATENTPEAIAKAVKDTQAEIDKWFKRTREKIEKGEYTEKEVYTEKIKTWEAEYRSEKSSSLRRDIHKAAARNINKFKSLNKIEPGSAAEQFFNMYLKEYFNQYALVETALFDTWLKGGFYNCSCYPGSPPPSIWALTEKADKPYTHYKLIYEMRSPREVSDFREPKLSRKNSSSDEDSDKGKEDISSTPPKEEILVSNKNLEPKDLLIGEVPKQITELYKMFIASGMPPKEASTTARKLVEKYCEESKSATSPSFAHNNAVFFKEKADSSTEEKPVQQASVFSRVIAKCTSCTIL